MAARITGASLDPILTRLNGVDNYHPLDAETFSDWSIEAGDLVTVSRNGVSYKSPVHTSTLTWKGTTPQVKISSTGREARDPVSVAARKKYGRGSSALLNSQQAYKDIITSYNNMTAGLILASSSASLYVLDMYNQMKSGLDLTSSTAALYVNDAYNQMKAGLDLTSSTAALYVLDMYNQMSAGLDLTSSTAALYVIDSYNQMKSGLDLTSSTAAVYVNDKYNQMTAGLDLTSSTAAVYVENMYNQMKAGLDVTSSSAALYTESKTTRAYIMTRINSDESEALIEADKVSITGNTTLAGSLEISSGNLVVKKSANFQGNITLTTSGSTVQAPQFAVSSGGYLRLIGTQTGEHYDLTAASIQGYIRKAEVDSNTNQLKLWKVSDSDQSPSITFSKAVALEGDWDNGQYTVSATSGSISGTVPRETVASAFSNPSANVYYLDINSTNESGTLRTVKQTEYKLALHGSGAASTVQIQDEHDAKFPSSHELAVGSLYTDGRNSVTLSGSWTNRTFTVEATNGEDYSETLQYATGTGYGQYDTITIDSFDSSHIAYADVKTSSAQGGNVLYGFKIDASGQYTSGTYAGKESVTISSTLVWTTTPASDISVSQNAVTLSTSGRTNTSGTASEDTETVNLYSQASTSGLKATFYVTHTDSTDAKRILKKEVTCTDSNFLEENIKDGVTMFGKTGSYTGTTPPYTLTEYDVYSKDVGTVPGWTKSSSSNYYYQNGQSGTNAKIRIYTYGVVTIDGKSKSSDGIDYSYLEDVPTAVSRNAYSNGYSNGSPASLATGSKYANKTWNFTITRGDGTAVTKTADCTTIYNEGHDSVVLAEIDLNGSSSETSPTKPTTALSKSGTSISGYKWLQLSDGTWKKLGSFSITPAQPDSLGVSTSNPGGNSIGALSGVSAGKYVKFKIGSTQYYFQCT